MTENPGTGAAENVTHDANSTDWFLAHLVGWANKYNIEQGITLTVGGATISGKLISGRKYFEEIAAATAAGSSNSEEVKLSIAESHKLWSAIYDKPEGAPDDYEPPPPGYIHLRDALWISFDGKFLPSNGVLWRGKLSAIDGFCLGQMRPSTQK
jgi:hypothetical protein